jgi:O-acetyl-ADP-ribose deacetylase (regulator of RNase III)
MVIVNIVDGDLLDATEPYIAQQCNCTTVTAYGLSKSIANKWKHGDVYSQRSKRAKNPVEPDTPGSVVITTSPSPGPGPGPTLLHLMAQWSPGRLGSSNRYYPQTYQDTRINRELWFQDCLNALDTIVDSKDTVAMPYLIGCGLAGGNWSNYQNMLQRCKTQIKLYRKS